MDGIDDIDLGYLQANGVSNIVTTPPEYTFTCFANNSRAVLMLSSENLIICDTEGKPIAVINLGNGSVKLSREPDEVAKQFWKAVLLMHHTFVSR